MINQTPASEAPRFMDQSPAASPATGSGPGSARTCRSCRACPTGRGTSWGPTAGPGCCRSPWSCGWTPRARRYAGSSRSPLSSAGVGSSGPRLGWQGAGNRHYSWPDEGNSWRPAGTGSSWPVGGASSWRHQWRKGGCCSPPHLGWRGCLGRSLGGCAGWTCTAAAGARWPGGGAGWPEAGCGFGAAVVTATLPAPPAAAPGSSETTPFLVIFIYEPVPKGARRGPSIFWS